MEQIPPEGERQPKIGTNATFNNVVAYRLAPDCLLLGRMAAVVVSVSIHFVCHTLELGRCFHGNPERRIELRYTSETQAICKDQDESNIFNYWE